MPDPINLRQARKAKARSEKERVSAQNRITFGQSKASKALDSAVVSLASHRLDGLRRDKEDDT
jgi:hypothetical protein